MTMPTTQFQVMNSPTQNPIAGTHLHTPSSIFNHMMAQQNIPHEPGSWNQMPQVPPMYMPWSVPNLQPAQLMRFTGEKPPVYPPPLHHKRKIEVPDIPDTRPTKQFISEEKMAAHFRDMHISTNYSSTPLTTASTSYNIQPQPSTSSQLDINVDTSPAALENGKSMHPKLVISEELKRIQQEPILPASLLSKLERPSMALVLWEPPSKHLRMLRPHTESVQINAPSEDNDNNNNNNNNNNRSSSTNDNNNNIASDNNIIQNNNNQLMPDLNQMSAIQQNDVEFEPMDV
ncbi:putative uncharacterized protein DDB_G0292292 [Chelonus insularis]|uniref:putative uncharacterized protein DDB_G0292292 n=1 Tax=Chelonus insularis TaxID=460826 RepID=UPI00158CC479|nr:putative uncharacterized protein DDB_G0292292 [Chelonus insularis]XP_034946097.1 putative uncharacterized protein DDB_G0292292 [Chelonus insularis]